MKKGSERRRSTPLPADALAARSGRGSRCYGSGLMATILTACIHEKAVLLGIISASVDKIAEVCFVISVR